MVSKNILYKYNRELTKFALIDNIKIQVPLLKIDPQKHSQLSSMASLGKVDRFTTFTKSH